MDKYPIILNFEKKKSYLFDRVVLIFFFLKGFIFYEEGTFYKKK